MSTEYKPTETNIYPVRAVIVTNRETDLIRPNDANSLTFSGDVDMVGENSVRKFLQGSPYQFPSLSIIANLGVANDSHGFLFRPATNQSLNRNFTWRTEDIATVEARVEAHPEQYDPTDLIFIESIFRRYLHRNKA
jgi:hypothetical protein